MGEELPVSGCFRAHGVAGAGAGWLRDHLPPSMLAWGIAERVDDYSAAAFVYCARVQAVPRVDAVVAVADVERRAHESPSRMEVGLGVLGPAEG